MSFDPFIFFKKQKYIYTEVNADDVYYNIKYLYFGEIKINKFQTDYIESVINIESSTTTLTRSHENNVKALKKQHTIKQLIPEAKEKDLVINALGDSEQESESFYKTDAILKPSRKNKISTTQFISFILSVACSGFFYGGGLLSFFIADLWPWWFWFSLAITVTGTAAAEGIALMEDR